MEYNKHMLLAIDIGNTNITIGLYSFKKGRRLLKVWRLATNSAFTADEYGIKILSLLEYSKYDYKNISAIVVASVVPMLDKVFEDMSAEYFNKKAYFVRGQEQKCIKILYDNPKEVGADRIANAAAGFKKFGGPLIIIDFGTATTFDCISSKGEYLGGVIVPGPRIAADSLYVKTAKLPKVEIRRTKNVIGTNTISSIQSGIYYGYVGMIKEILNRVLKEMNGKPKVIATGGLAALIVSEIKEVKEVVPELTLDGICVLSGC
jgi:type III pantothenate kinase